KSMRLGALYFFDLLTFARIPTITPYESFSLNSDLIWHFNDGDPFHYNLFNVRYVVAPPSLSLPGFLRRLKETPRYILYAAPTSGYGQFGSVASRDTEVSQQALFAANKTWFTGKDSEAALFVKHDFPRGTERGHAEGAPLSQGGAQCVRTGTVLEAEVKPSR